MPHDMTTTEEAIFRQVRAEFDEPPGATMLHRIEMYARLLDSWTSIAPELRVDGPGRVNEAYKAGVVSQIVHKQLVSHAEAIERELARQGREVAVSRGQPSLKGYDAA